MHVLARQTHAAIIIQNFYRKYSKNLSEKTAFTQMQIKAVVEKGLGVQQFYKANFSEKRVNRFSHQASVAGESYIPRNQRLAIEYAIEQGFLCLETKVVTATESVLFAYIGEPLLSTVYLPAVHGLMQSGFTFPNTELRKTLQKAQGVGTFVTACYSALSKYPINDRRKFNECWLGALFSKVIEDAKSQRNNKPNLHKEPSMLAFSLSTGEGKKYVAPHKRGAALNVVKTPDAITIRDDFFVNTSFNFHKLCEMAAVVIYRQNLGTFTNFISKQECYLGKHNNKIIKNCNKILASLSLLEKNKFNNHSIGKLFNNIYINYLKEMKKSSQ
jgi:hypothetical protein